LQAASSLRWFASVQDRANITPSSGWHSKNMHTRKMRLHRESREIHALAQADAIKG
jgi:hypothetical protein